MSCKELKPDAPECMRRGLTQLSPGSYSCADGHLHVVVPELLRAAGYPVTPENVAMMERAARDLPAHPTMEVRIVE